MAAAPPPAEPPARSRAARWSLTGVLLAEAAYIAALRPSLLPRSALLQAVVCALAMVLAYALGAAIGAAARVAARRGVPAVPGAARVGWIAPRAGWTVAGVLGAVAVVATIPRMADQADQAAAIGAPAGAPAWWLVAALSVLLAWLLVLAGRGLRRAARWVTGRVPAGAPGWLRGPATGAVAVTVAVVAVVVAGYGLLVVVFDRLDASTAGQSPPASSLRSGGPGSLVPWDSLGAEGRAFVSGGASQAELAAFAGAGSPGAGGTSDPVGPGPGAMEPIRVFAGLDSAPDAASRAALAVAELERTGGLTRGTVVVTTTTGNGFVDPVAADSLEYVLAGDVANVAMQYSVLPSWLSFLVDGNASQEAGTALLRAVQAAIADLPPGERPRLVVYGESLGAFGSQAAFDGMTPEQVVEQVDAALWVGPPSASGLWSRWTADATGGTAWQPELGGGRTVRFAATAGAIEDGIVRPDVWGARRILYAQNATDPVVWFDPALLWSRPAWLDDPRGPGVPAQVRWWPMLLFEQVLLDLPAAVSAPPGSGHDYADQVPVGWVAVLQPPDWTPADTDRLHVAVD